MKRYLIFKILAIHLLIIGFSILLVWVAVDTLAAGYFVTLMEKYNISPGPAHEMFVTAIHRYLVWAALGAILLAVALSYALTRRALSPLTRMAAVSREIAAGNYSVSVPVRTADEVGQLAEAFNRMARSLKTLEELRRTLMIDVAHELRTPLTNIRGYLEALDDGVLPPSKEVFSLLNAETMRLVRLVEDVLRLARADAAHGRLVKAPADLAELIKNAAEASSETLSEKHLLLETRIPEDPVMIRVDADRFARVLRNLTENAVGYAPEHSIVRVRIQQDANEVQVLYSNDAPEFSPEDLPYIFERFYRGEKSRSRIHGGAGIGLSIVKELVEAHGGRVSADFSSGRLSVGFSLPAGVPAE